MRTWQTILYILAVILLVLAAFDIGRPRVSLALLGAAAALLAYALPAITANT
jgi:hypothetical protein